jgi:hypothetical protein
VPVDTKNEKLQKAPSSEPSSKIQTFSRTDWLLVEKAEKEIAAFYFQNLIFAHFLFAFPRFFASITL